MKKYLIFFAILIIPISVQAKSVNIDLYYGKECPYCHRELIYLDKLQKQLGKNININKYEVWHNKKNKKIMNDIISANEEKEIGVPYTIIGDKTFVGYNDNIAKNIKKTIISQIDDEMYLPILGKTNVKKTNSYLMSFLSGIADSVNFGSLFILLVLSGLLLGIYNNKKRIILGSIYIITSSIIYFIFGLLKIDLSNFILMVIKMIVNILPILIGTIYIDCYLKIKDPNISILEILQQKFKSKEMLYYSILIMICAFIITFVSINYLGGVSVILKKALSIKNITKIKLFSNLFTYFIGYLLFSYVLFIAINIIVKEIFMENSISVYNRLIGGVLLFVLSSILIFMPSLFLF